MYIKKKFHQTSSTWALTARGITGDPATNLNHPAIHPFGRALPSPDSSHLRQIAQASAMHRRIARQTPVENKKASAAIILFGSGSFWDEIIYIYIYICHKLLEHHYSSFKLQPFDLMGEELLRLILHVLILKPNLKPQLQVCRKTTWAYNPKFTRSSRAKFDQHERKWPKKTPQTYI